MSVEMPCTPLLEGAVRKTKYLLPAAILVATLVNLKFNNLRLLGLFEDDFYYYAKIAANLVSGAGSTFNGI